MSWSYRSLRHARAAYLLAAGTALACTPRDFDELERAHDAIAGDASVMHDGGLDAAVPSALPGAVDATIVDAGSCPDAPDGGRTLRIERAAELGRLRHPAALSGRSLGVVASLGAGRTWFFNSTRPTPGTALPAGTPTNYPSAARDGSDAPWLPGAAPGSFRLDDALTPDGLPPPLVTLEPEADASDGIGLNATSVIRRAPDAAGGLAFVQRTVGLDGPSEIFMADVEDGATQARLRPRALFRAPEPMFSLGAQHADGFIVLFACVNHQRGGAPRTVDCQVARVPRERVDQRDAYEVRTRDAEGRWSWTRDLRKGVPVIDDADGDLSVAWNAHLGKYVAVHSPRFLGPRMNRIVLQTADAIEGPYTLAAELPVPATPVWTAHGAREQPALESGCGERLVLSYWAPQTLDRPDGFPLVVDVVLLSVDLE